MRLRDAKEQIEREHPELTGNAKLEAIKALREQAAATEKAQKALGVPCPHCGQQVKPVEKSGLVTFTMWLLLLASASLVAAGVAAVHTFTAATVHGGWVVVLWPVAAARGWAHPKLLAVIIAFVVTMAVAWVAVRLNERAKRNARCPKCGHRMPAEAEPQS